MGIDAYITDIATGRKAKVINGAEEDNALLVAVRDYKTYTSKTIFFTNPTYGADMNQNVTFGGTPDKIYDGGDSSLWTASTITGGAGDFLETDTTHAHGGIITVVDYSLIDVGETFTINGTARAEGTDWDAETNNDTTATNIAADITANITGFTATASGAVVTVTAETGYDLTECTTSGEAGEMTATQQSLNASPSANGDTIQFAKGSDVTCANYTTITGWIYITGWPSENQNVELYAWDTGADEQVGVSVYLRDYIDTNLINYWQQFVISLDDLEIETSTTVDAFRLKTIDIGLGAPPDYFIDSMQIEETGSTLEYTITTEEGTWFHIQNFKVYIVDAVAGDSANDIHLSYDKFLGVALNNGCLYQRIEDGVVTASANIQGIGDILQDPNSSISAIGSDDTNTFIAIEKRDETPFTLKYENNDIIRIVIRDNLSGLLKFRISVYGYEEERG